MEKQFDFTVVCPSCKSVLDVPAKVPQHATIYNGVKFGVYCPGCDSSFESKIQISSTVLENKGTLN